MYNKIPFEDMFIPLEDLEYAWSREDIIKVENFWKEGASLYAISKGVKRNPIEVAILIADLIIRKRLKPRNGEPIEEMILKAV